jgi:hypothetical protein
MRGAILPLPNTPSWRGAYLSTGTTLFFTLNDLNAKLHSEQKPISDIFGAVRSSGTKLKPFRERFENVKLCHFCSCGSLRKVGSVNILFASARAVEMIDYLAENSEVRFS